MPIRAAYVCNSDPQFQVPEHHTHKLPFVLSDALERVRGVDLTTAVEFYVNLPAGRCRRINAHRRRAINAIISALLHHTNVVTRIVRASAEALADFCGLSTVSAAQNKSITRATRALIMLKHLGLIDYERRWDRVSKQYFPAKIEVKESLLQLVGVTPQRWQKAVDQKLNYYNAKNSKRLGKAVTENEYRRIVREEQLERVWQLRKTAREIKAKQKAAERARRLAEEKGEAELRHAVTQQVTHEYVAGDYPGATLADLQRIVDKRLNTLKKTWNSIQ